MLVLAMVGGVVGVTTAYQLLKDGHEVVLLERRDGRSTKSESVPAREGDRESLEGAARGLSSRTASCDLVS
jgi:glycine/D-amino acid oxidase-like deaminating enzyme